MTKSTSSSRRRRPEGPFAEARRLARRPVAECFEPLDEIHLLHNASVDRCTHAVTVFGRLVRLVQRERDDDVDLAKRANTVRVLKLVAEETWNILSEESRRADEVHDVLFKLWLDTQAERLVEYTRSLGMALFLVRGAA